MPRKRKHYAPVRKLEVPQISEAEYRDLIDIIYEDIFQGNRTAIARTLGVSVPTVGRMKMRPPGKGSQWWWTIVLREIIKRMHEQLEQSPHKRDRMKAQEIRHSVSSYGHADLMSNLVYDTQQAEGSTQFLVALLWDKKPYSKEGMISVSDLNREAREAGYEPRTLRSAAQRLCLIREKRGDEWFWRFPDQEDLA